MSESIRIWYQSGYEKGGDSEAKDLDNKALKL